MRVVEHSGASIEQTLSELDDAYGRFPINQTTVTVSPGRYDRARTADGQDWIDLYAIVRNGDGEVLHVDGENGCVLPGTAVDEGESLEPRLRSTVREQTGIDCRIARIAEARIVGIRDSARDDSDTVYRLAIVFNSESRAGSPTDDACWLDDVQGLPVCAENRG
jgi:ADP-ribose pyrophosphatase YjhB (NUDIX family)